MTSAATLVRDARAKAGLSCRGLAERAGIAASTVSRIEGAETDPTYTMLMRILGAAKQELQASCVDLDTRPSLAHLSDAWKLEGQQSAFDWTRLRGFTGWLQLHPELTSMAIATPPARTGTPLDALLASLAEKLADDAHIARPPWTAAVPALKRAWKPSGTPRMVAEARRRAMPQFRARNLIIRERDLWHQHG